MALITGASSGIGLELAKIHAQRKGNCVLIARNEKKLKELKEFIVKTYNTEVIILVKDLAKIDSAKEIYDSLKTKKVKIDYLINNAGFGGYGSFFQRDWKLENEMINVNINSLVTLSNLFLKEMLNNGQGKILNVASLAAYSPGPLQAVYFATKAFVLSFSVAIADELRKRKKITVTALCPGATATNFLNVAKLEGSNMAKGNIVSAYKVAKIGYQAMLKGKRIVHVPKINPALLTGFVTKIFSARIARKYNEKK